MLATPRQPSDAEVERLDPYAFMAVIGKRVIHPGGRRSTREMLSLRRFATGERVLDVGCGVATTAIELAQRFRCHVTAVDIDPRMLDRARANVIASQTADVDVMRADIQALGLGSAAFDCVVVEAGRCSSIGLALPARLFGSAGRGAGSWSTN